VEHKKICQLKKMCYKYFYGFWQKDGWGLLDIRIFQVIKARIKGEVKK